MSGYVKDRKQELKEATETIDTNPTTIQRIEWEKASDKDIVENSLLYQEVMKEIQQSKSATYNSQVSEEMRSDFLQLAQELDIPPNAPIDN